jgi:hypothetical protein
MSSFDDPRNSPISPRRAWRLFWLVNCACFWLRAQFLAGRSLFTCPHRLTMVRRKQTQVQRNDHVGIRKHTRFPDGYPAWVCPRDIHPPIAVTISETEGDRCRTGVRDLSGELRSGGLLCRFRGCRLLVRGRSWGCSRRWRRCSTAWDLITR